MLKRIKGFFLGLGVAVILVIGIFLVPMISAVLCAILGAIAVLALCSLVGIFVYMGYTEKEREEEEE